VPSQGGGDIASDKFIRLGPLCDARYECICEGAVDMRERSVARSKAQGRCHGEKDVTYIAIRFRRWSVGRLVGLSHLTWDVHR